MTPLFLIYLLYEKRKAPKREYKLFRLTKKRKRYFYEISAEEDLNPEDIHSDFVGKTIISGHTPTQLLAKEGRIYHKPELVNRYFIDGGSKGGRQSQGRINLLKLDANGNEIWRKYLTQEGIFNE